MSVACIIIKHLPCRVESARNSRLRHSPLVIYDHLSPLQRVVDASPGWAIHTDMPLETALARCPDAVAMPADHAEYRQQWRSAVSRLRGVAPQVDDAGPGIAYAQFVADNATLREEPRKVADLMRCLPEDWEPQVGIAADRFAAHCAASIARPDHALRVPDAPDLRHNFLASLPVRLLPVDVHILAGLYDRGIHRLGQLHDLSPRGLQAAVADLASAISAPAHHPTASRAA